MTDNPEAAEAKRLKAEIAERSDRLSEIEAPTLITWGRHDHVVLARDSAGYAQRIAHGELHIYDETGHVAMAERPVRFNRELARFVEQ